jgi:hypothetical protein
MRDERISKVMHARLMWRLKRAGQREKAKREGPATVHALPMKCWA